MNYLNQSSFVVSYNKIDSKKDVEDAESQEPAQESVAYHKAVHESENQFGVAEDGDVGRGKVVTVDECQSVEDEHYGGSESVVSLKEEGGAQDATSNHRNDEINQCATNGRRDGKVGLVFACADE